jgi:hypothetical protein
MPVLFIEAPAGIGDDAKKKMVEKMTARRGMARPKMCESSFASTAAIVSRRMGA